MGKTTSKQKKEESGLHYDVKIQTSKPKFASVFAQIEADLNALKLKINTPNKQK